MKGDLRLPPKWTHRLGRSVVTVHRNLPLRADTTNRISDESLSLGGAQQPSDIQKS